MKIKKFVIVGSLFLVLGIIAVIVSVVKADFDMNTLFSEEGLVDASYEGNMVDKIEINEKVENLIIKTDSTVSTIKISYTESDIRKYTITNENDTLVINQVYSKKWQDKLVNLPRYRGKMEITLPEQILSELKIVNTNGKVEVKNLNVIDCNIDGTNNYIVIKESNFTNLTMKSTNGSFELSNINVSENGRFKLTNGSCKITESNVNDLYIKLTNGDIKYTGSIGVKVDASITCGDINIKLNHAKGDLIVILDVTLGDKKITYQN